MSGIEITLDEYAKAILDERLHKKADFVAAICGLPGLGKSTFEVELGRRIDPSFSITRNIIFDPNPQNIIAKVTKELPPYSVVGLDEGIRAANSRKAFDPLNTFLVEYFALCRKDYKAILICIPSIRQLDSGIRETRVLHWIEIVKRGTAVVFSRSRVPGIDDPLGIKLAGKAIAEAYGNKRDIDLSDGDILRACMKSPRFAFMVHFDPMPPEIEKEYEEAATKMRKEIKPPSESSTIRAKFYKLVINKMVADLYSAGKTQSEISKKYELSLGFVNRALKEHKVRPLDEKTAEEIEDELSPDS